MEVYLIRHTSPDIEKGICYGQSDISLKESFEKEAGQLQSVLPEKLDIVYSSPLLRCKYLAEKLSLSCELIVDDRLLEMNFGDWEMKQWEVIEAGALSVWMNDFVKESPPGGESMEKLNHRVNSFIDHLAKVDCKKAGIVTHAGVIRCTIARILEIPLQNIFRIQLDYSSVTLLKISKDGIVIEYINKRL